MKNLTEAGRLGESTAKGGRGIAKSRRGHQGRWIRPGRETFQKEPVGANRRTSRYACPLWRYGTYQLRG